MPERARAGEQVEHARALDAGAEDREQRLAHAVGGRARRRPAGLQPAPAVGPAITPQRPAMTRAPAHAGIGSSASAP